MLLALAFQIGGSSPASYLAWFWLIRHYPATRLFVVFPDAGIRRVAGGALLGRDLTPAAAWLALNSGRRQHLDRQPAGLGPGYCGGPPAARVRMRRTQSTSDWWYAS